VAILEKRKDVGSKIYGIVTNVTGGSFWGISMSRAWDMIFTDKGLLFAKLGEVGWKSLIPGMEWEDIRRRYQSDAYKEERRELANLPLDKILEADKKNWFVPYDEIQQIRIRSLLGACGFDIKTSEGGLGKGFNFSKSQLDKMKKLVSKFLGNKLRKGWF